MVSNQKTLPEENYINILQLNYIRKYQYGLFQYFILLEIHFLILVMMLDIFQSKWIEEMTEILTIFTMRLNIL